MGLVFQTICTGVFTLAFKCRTMSSLSALFCGIRYALCRYGPSFPRRRYNDLSLQFELSTALQTRHRHQEDRRFAVSKTTMNLTSRPRITTADVRHARPALASAKLRSPVNPVNSLIT